MSTISDRIARVQLYFPNPDLQAAVTAGISNKSVDAITEADAKKGLCEGNWGYSVLTFAVNEQTPLTQRVSVFSQYVQAIQSLQQKPKFWEVDANIHVRLAWKLSLDAKRFSNLDSGCSQQIAQICTLYQDEITALAAKKATYTTEYRQIFADPKYRVLDAVLLKERAQYLTPKDCGNLFKLTDPAQRQQAIGLFLEGLGKNPSSETAQKLIEHFGKNVTKAASSLPAAEISLYQTRFAQIQAPAVSSSSSKAPAIAQQ